jgi:DNA-binding response OmpR family regulator
MAHILIVEDEPFLARLLAIGLQRVGHTTMVEHDGSEVFARARDQAPDLILLDVMLPGMDGFQVLKQLKRHPATHHIPVLMLTGRSDGHSVIAGLDGGADAYLSKPIDLSDLFKRIPTVLTRVRVAAHG